jgi:hypothetical protein
VDAVSQCKNAVLVSLSGMARAEEVSDAQVRAAFAERHALLLQSRGAATNDLIGKIVRLSGMVDRAVHVFWAPTVVRHHDVSQRVCFTGTVQGFTVDTGADGRRTILLQAWPVDHDRPDIHAE